jgi:hypothetical protein
VSDLKAEVLAAVDRFERNLGFTAPELIGMRIDELRGQIKGAFEEDGDDD